MTNVYFVQYKYDPRRKIQDLHDEILNAAVADPLLDGLMPKQDEKVKIILTMIDTRIS